MSDEYISVNDNSLEWQTIYQRAREDKSHFLWENYQSIKLSEYEYMLVQIRDNKPISFHGIYNNGRWPSNVSRVCNRMYVDPDYKDIKGLIPGSAARYDFINYDKWGKDVLFISRGVQYDNPELSFKKFQKFVLWLKKVTGVELEYDDRLYSCCSSECKDCYQFCVWYDPKHIRQTLDIPSIYIEDWKLLQ